MLSTIFSVAREQFPPVSAAHTSRIGMLTAPTAKSSKKRQAYDLAVQTAGATLPVVFKFGTDTEPVYREFATLEDLTDFYTKAMQHIQNTLADGWKKKDVFDLSLYAVD